MSCVSQTSTSQILSFCVCFKYLKGCLALSESHQEKSGVCLNGWSPSHPSSHLCWYLNRRLLPAESNRSGLALCLGLALQGCGQHLLTYPSLLDGPVLQSFSSSNKLSPLLICARQELVSKIGKAPYVITLLLMSSTHFDVQGCYHTDCCTYTFQE